MIGQKKDKENSLDSKVENSIKREGLEKKATQETESVVDKEAVSQDNMQFLKDKIEKMELDDSLKQQIQNTAQTIKNLKDEKKIKILLETAKEKGVVYAINVAKKMNDAYLVDTLHDVLSESGLYKKFSK